MIREQIEQAVAEALKTLGAEGVSFTVERPASMEHGDYATNAALAAAKVLKKNPREVAEEIQKNLEGKIEGVKKIEVAGAGFINFTISGMTIKDIVQSAHESEWGSNELYKNKKVMVEYTDPNPFKEFHIGHLMSNAIGESISRLLETSGAEVKRACYQGDVGLHVAKTIWAMREAEENSNFFQTRMPSDDAALSDKVKFLGDAYVFGAVKFADEIDGQQGGIREAVQSINEKIYSHSDSNITRLYNWGRKVSLDHFEEIYKKLGMALRNHFGELKYFDYYFFESMSWEIGKVLVQQNTPRVFEESDGAIVFQGEKYDEKLHTRVFLTAKGLPTYEAKELGLLKSKKEGLGKGFDRSITVTANEQSEYFKVVLTAAKQIPEIADVAQLTEHVPHGMMRFAEGKMSSRTGNIVTGESLLRDLQQEARGREDVAVGAIKYVVLRQASGKDIVFDREKSLSLEGDSGPYLQYALVRARALLRNAANAEVVQPEPSGPKPVERLIMHFPDVVEYAAKELEPHYVTTYLTELAGAFNSWYASERMIVDGKITTRNLAVVKAIENTLARGLQVLGIPTPEKM